MTTTNNINNNAARHVQRFNPITILCDHLVGKNHTHGHRMMVGVAVIIVGVFVAKTGAGTPAVVHILTDAIGYGVHGIGLVPFVEIFEKWRSNHE